MDIRCFAEHFNALSSTTQSTNIIFQQRRHQLGDVLGILRCERMDTDRLCSMASSIKRLEKHILGEEDSKPPASPTPPVILRQHKGCRVRGRCSGGPLRG